MRKSLIGLAAAAAVISFSTGGTRAVVVAPNAVFGAKNALGDLVEQAQLFYWQGRQYCWYDEGWSGPGWYWCGYAWRYGLGWGGHAGWHGWVVVRGGGHQGGHHDHDHHDHGHHDHGHHDHGHGHHDHHHGHHDHHDHHHGHHGHGGHGHGHGGHSHGGHGHGGHGHHHGR